MPQIRENIIDAYVARLQGITTGNGYATTVANVERGYRDPSQVGHSEMPYIGMIPSRESYQDTSGRIVRVRWSIILQCYLQPSAATFAALISSLSDISRDVRKAVYASPANWGVTGMISAKILGRQGSEGLCESRDERKAFTTIETEVLFNELVDS